MSESTPKKYTLIKLGMIAILLMLLFQFNREEIEKTWQSNSLSMTQKMMYSVQQLLGWRMPGDKEDSTESLPQEEVATSKAPQQLSPQVYELPHYQESQGFADHFNQTFDTLAFNESFIRLLNLERENRVSYGEQLVTGVTKRTAELSDYHYFDTKTVSGESFSTHYGIDENTAYQLGEYLYETTLSTYDVHATTWLAHPDIFAQKVLEDIKGESWDDVPNMQLALAVKANVAPAYLKDSPYIRLVVVVARYE